VKSLLRNVGVIGLSLAVLAGCASSGNKASPTTPTSPGTSAATAVVLKNIQFSPADIHIHIGDNVMWVWKDSPVPHNVTFSGFASATQESGAYSHTFTSAGMFRYTCTIHTNMTGTVTVT
jgi:plastocyanin